jgi:hypothetical protein
MQKKLNEYNLKYRLIVTFFKDILTHFYDVVGVNIKIT